MSREWYIRTDKRNIQDTFGDIDTTPPTFKEKWQQNHKKYILWMVEGVLLIAMLAVVLPIALHKDTTDYTVTLVTEQAVSDEAVKALETALSAHGVDRDGDGKIEVSVRALVPENNGEGGRNSALEQFITSFSTDEYTLFAMQPECYTRFLQSYIAEGVSLFEPLPAACDTYENLWEQPKNEQTPALLWGVRALPKAKGNAKEAQSAHLALLSAYVDSVK